MKFIDEFKEFIARGNVMDMAVGVVVGGAFKSIVDSLVGDIINPLLAFITSFGSKVAQTAASNSGMENNSQTMMDLSKWVIPGTGINIGNFVSSVISFLIMAFIIFCLVKGMNKLHTAFAKKEKEEEAAAPPAPTQEELLAEIRDLLKNGSEE